MHILASSFLLTLLYSCTFQATRIGRTINLVRKKTANEELSKRLKRIVKKWQALLVSLNSKKNSKSDSPSNFIPSSGNINGTISKTELLERPKSRNGNDRPSACTRDQQKKAKKRKLTRAENSPLNPKPISPKAKISSPNLHLKSNFSSTSKSHSPVLRRMGAGSPSISNVRSDSPKLNSKAHSPGTSSLNTKQSKIISKIDLNSAEKSVGIGKDIVYNNLNKTHIERGVVSNQQKQKGNISQHNLQNSAKITIHNFADIEKSKDTRIQENRIIEEAKHELKNNNSIDKKETHIDYVEQKRMSNKEKRDHYSENIGSSESGSFIVPKSFEPIESEELGINRRELPDNLLDVTSHADGINGIFSTESEKESWHDWTEVIPQRSNELHLLPYVILD